MLWRHVIFEEPRKLLRLRLVVRRRGCGRLLEQLQKLPGAGFTSFAAGSRIEFRESLGDNPCLVRCMVKCHNHVVQSYGKCRYLKFIPKCRRDLLQGLAQFVPKETCGSPLEGRQTWQVTSWELVQLLFKLQERLWLVGRELEPAKRVAFRSTCTTVGPCVVIVEESGGLMALRALCVVSSGAFPAA